MEKIKINDIDKIDLKGKVIVFPTDTVYGIGTKIDDFEGLKKIYAIKERSYNKPLAVLTPDFNIDKYVLNINPVAKELMREYWPGALTIIYKKSQLVNDLVSACLDTVGFRMPNSKIALKVLKQFGVMATTSINISGEEPLNDVNDIINAFEDKIDYIVMDQELQSKVSSTVISVNEDGIRVLRQGSVIIK